MVLHRQVPRHFSKSDTERQKVYVQIMKYKTKDTFHSLNKWKAIAQLWMMCFCNICNIHRELKVSFSTWNLFKEVNVFRSNCPSVHNTIENVSRLQQLYPGDWCIMFCALECVFVMIMHMIHLQLYFAVSRSWSIYTFWVTSRAMGQSKWLPHCPGSTHRRSRIKESHQFICNIATKQNNT